MCVPIAIFFFKYFLCIFGYVRSSSRHVASSLSHEGFSLVVVHGLSCPVGSQFPDQGSHPHPLHWKVNSQALDAHTLLPFL